LIIDDKYNIVLDGSHRYVILMQEGFEYTPVIKINYNDPHVRVGTHRMHRLIVNGPLNISKAEVIHRGISGKLFPPRTTRHFIPFLRPEINIPLKTLGKMDKADMNWIIARVNKKEEIKHNKKYIKELEEEQRELKNYMKECNRTKKYLKQQIEQMLK